MQFLRTLVEAAIGLYTDGLSLRRVRRRIRKLFAIVIKSDQTILDWLKKFGKRPGAIVHDLAPRLHADETLLKTFKKGLFFYFWAIRCAGSQPVGWHVSKQRTLTDTKRFLWETRRHFPPAYLPVAIRTDKMPAYRQAIMQVFAHAVRHEKVLSFTHGNNVIENFWRCKNRFPRFRTLESARRFVAHWLWENFENSSSPYFCIIRRLETTTYLYI